MTRIFNPEEIAQPLYSAPQYPTSNNVARTMGLTGRKNQEVRALTIAAFRIAQNDDQLTQKNMHPEILLHTLAGSRTAINYWLNEKRLSLCANGYYSLTQKGLEECEKALSGQASGYSTTEEKVREWTHRILTSDSVAIVSKRFPAAYWAAQ